VDLFKLAKYPFIAEAKEWVKNEKVSIDEILFDEIYERARVRGIERVRQAFERGFISNVALLNEIDCMMEIFSYPIARMIVVAIDNDYLLRRYALTEAKKAYEGLKEEEFEFIQMIAKEFDIELDGNKIHFVDYLKYAPTWDIKWKLVNKKLKAGYVFIRKNEVARILQEAIRKKIYNELVNLFAPPEVKKAFKDEIMEIRNKLILKQKKEEIRKGEIKYEDFPPCMQSLISAIKSGLNVPHVGRFTIVTFLNAIGQSVDEILKLFSSSPDFNEEKTRYQIEHITGRISGTIYATPKCDTIRTWGLCNATEECRGIRHPLIFYKRKRRRK